MGATARPTGGLSPILEPWTYVSRSTAGETVFPDGCRDLIVAVSQGRYPACFVSPLQIASRDVRWPREIRLIGFRLRPGTVVDETGLLSAVKSGDMAPVRLAGLVEAHCHLPRAVEDAVTGLSTGARSVGEAARSLGVSLRTLQRLFLANGQMPPEYWLLLARARRAARLLRSPGTLADIAYEAGYSDQAHMTRDFRRWFAITPARLRGDPVVLDRLCQSGLATPVTGEHISIR